MLPKSDTPGAGMELPALCELMSRKLAAQDPDEVVRRAFRAFDTKRAPSPRASPPRWPRLERVQPRPSQPLTPPVPPPLRQGVHRDRRP